MIFDNAIFTEMLLPFLLVFVLMFAILQKSKILGEGKAQIDALVSLAVALILIGVPGPRNIVVNLMPWLAVGAATILVFLILYGFVAGDLKEGPKWMKLVFGILAGVFVLGVLVYITGLWVPLQEFFAGNSGNEWIMNILLIVIIGGAMAVAIATGKKSKD